MNEAHLFIDDVDTGGRIITHRLCSSVDYVPDMQDFWAHKEWFAELPVGYTMCITCEERAPLFVLIDVL